MIPMEAVVIKLMTRYGLSERCAKNLYKEYKIAGELKELESLVFRERDIYVDRV